MNKQVDSFSPHECFIVYEDYSMKFALSLRNRLSQKGLKIMAWDEKHFKEQAFRMSNHNRILILDDNIESQFLSNPEITMHKLTDYVYYKREGHVASINIYDYVNMDDIIRKEIDDWSKISTMLPPTYVWRLAVSPIAAFFPARRYLRQNKRLALLFEAANVFEEKFMDDFINAI